MAQTEQNKFVKEVAEKKYEYGFTTDVHTDVIPVGLNEDIVRLISEKKGEPEWLLDFRLKAFRHWQSMKEPKWGHVNVPKIDYQAISYYADPLAKKPANKEIDPELEKTFDKLGIPLEERLALSGVAVDAIMDSVSVKTTFKKQLAEKEEKMSEIEAKKVAAKDYVEKANKDGLFHYHINKVDEDAVEEEYTPDDQDFILGIRPEAITIHEGADNANSLDGKIYSAMPTGMETTIRVSINGFLLTGVIFGASSFTLDEDVKIKAVGESIMLFDRKHQQFMTLGSLEVL